MSLKNQLKMKTALYVPPHARKSTNEAFSFPSVSSLKPVKLCENSNMIFEKAAEIEERNSKLYNDYISQKKRLRTSTEEECLPICESEDVGAERPETSTVAAKRFVTRALGIKTVFTDSELEDIAKLEERRKKNTETPS